MASEIFEETTKKGLPSWKICIITGLAVFAFMLVTDIIASLQSKDILIEVPVITRLFNFPPHIFQRGESRVVRQDVPGLEKATVPALAQFIIGILIIVSLILLLIFK